MTYQVQLEVFAGPLDLLLHLIERSELDIYDIPIAVITEQFLAYLRAMEMLNLEIAGEFIVMAATLMQIKAKMLLPKPVSLALGQDEEEEDPRRELVDRLVEYRRIKEAAGLLKQKEEEQAAYYTRGGGEFADRQIVPADNPLGEIGIWDLIDAFQSVLSSLNPDETVVRVPAEEVSVRQIMHDLLRALAQAGGELPFAQAIGGQKTRKGLITAFVALLELIRQGRVKAFQKGVFAQISLRLCRAEGVPT